MAHYNNTVTTAIIYGLLLLLLLLLLGHRHSDLGDLAIGENSSILAVVVIIIEGMHRIASRYKRVRGYNRKRRHFRVMIVVVVVVFE